MKKDDKPDVFMPLVIGDYKKDTGRLTRDLHGGYLLLIMEYWNTGPLSDDDAELAAIVLATPREWRSIRPKLERFFRVSDGRWHHKRIDAELAAAVAQKAKNKARAEAAAAARWERDGSPKPPGKRARSNATSTPKAVLEQCPVSSPTEVDGPTGQSTLCGRDAPEARPDGASGLRAIEGGKGEREAWAAALRQAESDLPHFVEIEPDPDFASEIAEFVAAATEKLSVKEQAA